MSFLAKLAPRGGQSFLSRAGSWLWKNVGKPLFGTTSRGRKVTDVALPTSLASTTEEAAPAVSRIVKEARPRTKGTVPAILEKVVPALAQWGIDVHKGQQATALAKEEAEKAAELQTRLAEDAARRQYTTARLTAQQRADEREMERQELAAQYQSEQEGSASRQQAAEFTTMMAARYPQLFSQFPQYMGMVEGQALGALMAPADPSDPLYAQKALGEIEYNLSLAEARVRATAKAPALLEPMHIPPEPTAVSRLGKLDRPAGYRTDKPSSAAYTTGATSTKTAADKLRKKLREAQRAQKSGSGRRKGGGLVTVFDA